MGKLNSSSILSRGDAALVQFALQKPQFKKGMESGDPLIAVWSIWAELYKTKDFSDASKKIDMVIQSWDLNKTPKLTYKYAYQELEAGWWSSMDMLLMPLLLTTVWQETGNTEYLKLARGMLKIALTSPTTGGSLWPDDGNGCWFSEYSWPGMTQAQEYYVLNGHLFSLTALKLLADAWRDDKLAAVFDCAVKGTKTRIKEFEGKNGWPLYQLVPATINMPHYVIFEQMQFGNLNALSKDPIWREQLSLRQSILERQYPVYLVRNGKEQFLFFSGIGAPHPYEPDLFLNEIECHGGKKASLKRIEAETLPKGRFYQSTPVNFKIDRCDVYSLIGAENKKIKIFSTRNIVQIQDEAPKKLAPSVEAAFDAVYESKDQVRIDPSLSFSSDGKSHYLDTQGRITFRFPEIALKPETLLAVELTSDSSLDTGAIFFSKDASISRYYRPLIKDKNNLVVLSNLGFDKSELISSIDAMSIVIWTDKMEKTAQIKVGDLYLIENNYQLYSLLRTGRAVINFSQQ